MTRRERGLVRRLTGLLCALIGLMLYLVAASDSPYRGTVSVGPDALERVFEQTMLPSD